MACCIPPYTFKRKSWSSRWLLVTAVDDESDHLTWNASDRVRLTDMLFETVTDSGFAYGSSELFQTREHSLATHAAHIISVSLPFTLQRHDVRLTTG